MSRKVLLAAALAFVAFSAPAYAAPALNGTFDINGKPGRIATGPDGNVWFTLVENGSGGEAFGKITPDGTVTEYLPPTDVASMVGITAGADGKLWATAINHVVRIDPLDPEHPTAFTDNNIGAAGDITTGPDGHLWTGSQNHVIEIPPDNPGEGPAGGDETHNGIVSGNAVGITTGGDGNLWIIDSNAADSAIARFDTNGNLVGTPVKPGGDSLLQSQIVAGPPGQLLFTQPVNDTHERVGHIDYSGHIDFTDMPGGLGDPIGVVFGNDGAYWIQNFGADKVRRLTPTGTLTEPISFDTGSGGRYIAKGANDTLWVSLETSSKIARVTGVSAPPVATVPPTIPRSATFAGVKPRGRAFRVKGKFVTIPLPCPAGLPSNCDGRITLRTQKAVAAKKKRRLKLGSAKFSIKPATTKRVRVKLSKKALRLIRRKHTLKAVASIRATAGGASKTTSKRVTLKRKR